MIGSPFRAAGAWCTAAAIALGLFGMTRPVGAQPAQLDRHAGVFDAAQDRFVIFGGYDGLNRRNETWALTLSANPTWTELTPAGPPSARFGHSAVLDSARARMVVFGGWAASGPTHETWSLSLTDPQAWSQLTPGGTPPSNRPYHSAIHDPVRDQMVVFGGDGLITFFNDLHTLSLGDTPTWSTLTPSGPKPSGRRNHSAIYDPVRDRMIVFAGWPLLNDVWALSLADTTWSLVSTTGESPSPRSSHTAIYDSATDRMIVFGGTDGNQPLNDVWALTLSDPMTWTPLLTTGLLPAARSGHATVYVPNQLAMLTFGGFPYGSDQTWALWSDGSPVWSPAQPVITVRPPILLFPTVTIGDTVVSTFNLSNLGLEPLNVSAIDLPSGDLVLDSAPPFSLAWRQQDVQTLTLAARTPAAGRDSLVIESNDPNMPRRSLLIDFEIRGLDFATRVLGQPAAVPLGRSFVVVVTPDFGVRLERGKLFYRVAGSTAPFDSVSLVPLATDFIAAVPAEAVTELGVEYYVEVRNSAFLASDPPGAPAAGVTVQAVAPATSFQAVPRPTSGSDYLEGREIEVEMILPNGATAVSGRIHYRRGGDTAYASDTLSLGALGRPVGTIPDSMVGARGLEYWVELQTERSDLRYPGGAAAAEIVRVRVQNLTEPSIRPGERYRMLTVPLDLGEDFSGSLDDLLTDQLGTYDPLRWRSFLYDPATSQNVEFSSEQAAAFRPVPGRAFWMVSRDAHQVDTSPIDGNSTDTSAPQPIVLSPGWNQFGNPFSFAVAWADVMRSPSTVLPPVWFDPDANAYASATPATLEPFEGYFIENVGAMPETLWVPPVATPVPTPTTAARSRIATSAGTDWRLRLAAQTEHAVDAINDFGIHPDAGDAYDPLDLREPPAAPGPWVRSTFANTWRELPGHYRRDLRSSAEGHVWEIEVRSTTRGEAVTLDLSALTPVPADFAIELIDRELGTVVALELTPRKNARAATASQTIVSTGADRPYRLAIVAGSADFVARAAQQAGYVPSRLVVHASAPNPFRTATQIRFALPRASRVSVEIFSVLGERVATLHDDTPLEAGQHTVVWDGRHVGGAPAASGIYLIRVQDAVDARSSRLVLIR